MHLTRDEEDVLAGESGAVKQKSMEILVALGDIYNAERLVPIESAQIAGVSYKTIGEAGLEVPYRPERKSRRSDNAQSHGHGPI